MHKWWRAVDLRKSINTYGSVACMWFYFVEIRNYLAYLVAKQLLVVVLWVLTSAMFIFLEDIIFL